MPLYTFELREGSAPVFDDAGIDLPDRKHALAYAKEVASELMLGREAKTRSWRLDVYENHENRQERVFELLFVTLDNSLDHVVPEIRGMLERLCDSYRSCKETVHAARITVRESRALIAKSRGKPYLAAMAGKTTIR